MEAGDEDLEEGAKGWGGKIEWSAMYFSRPCSAGCLRRDEHVESHI